MTLPRTTATFAATLAALVAALALAVVGVAPAQASPCGRIKVDVSKKVVKPGQTLRVSGATCTDPTYRPRFLRIKLRTKKGWRQVGIARTRRNGRFSRRVPARVSQDSVPKTYLRVEAAEALSPSVPLTIANEIDTSNCALNDPSSEVGMTLAGCELVASDTASEASPLNFWGNAECGTWPSNLDPGRPTRPTTGGDTHPTATGALQEDDAFRSLTVFDGDDISGERCELGRNDLNTGPTTFFYEGMRRATFFSLRLPDNFALDTEDWQTVFQMKQAQPSQDDGGGPMIELQATRGEWVVANDWDTRWTFPAQKGVWTRFAFDVVYSQDPNQGSIQVSADLNGDGDFDDADERSPKLGGATLATQTAPGYDVPPGGSIPSHIRAGIYHNEKFSCPRPVGCSTELDNLQVIGS